MNVDRLTPLPALMLCSETADKGTKYRSTNRSDAPDCNRVCSTHGPVDIPNASTTSCEDWGAEEAGEEAEYQKRCEIRRQCDRKL